MKNRIIIAATVILVGIAGIATFAYLTSFHKVSVIFNSDVSAATVYKEKGEETYHFYLSYFRPRWSDCSSGFFTDNVGLVQWKNYDGKAEKNRFFALENCAQVSHVLLHEVGRQKKYGKKYRDTIHEQWDKHIYNVEEYEFYDKRVTKVEKRDDFLFATMKIPTTSG